MNYLTSNRHFYSSILPFFLALLFIIQSCKPSAPKVEAGAGDLTGFDITAIPGSAFQHAVRKDGAGQVVFEGYVLNNKKAGEWLEYNAEREIVMIEHYIDGIKEGVSLKLTPRGQIEQRARYHQGLLHGSWIQYKFGKIIEDRNYNMGKLDGVVKMYDDRNWTLKQEVAYKDGKQHGFFRYYDDKGNVTLEYEYKDGEKVSGGIVEKK